MHFALFILVTSHTIAFTCKMELLVLDLLRLQLVQGGRAVGGRVALSEDFLFKYLSWEKQMFSVDIKTRIKTYHH